MTHFDLVIPCYAQKSEFSEFCVNSSTSSWVFLWNTLRITICKIYEGESCSRISPEQRLWLFFDCVLTDLRLARFNWEQRFILDFNSHHYWKTLKCIVWEDRKPTCDWIIYIFHPDHGNFAFNIVRTSLLVNTRTVQAFTFQKKMESVKLTLLSPKINIAIRERKRRFLKTAFSLTENFYCVFHQIRHELSGLEEWCKSSGLVERGCGKNMKARQSIVFFGSRPLILLS